MPAALTKGPHQPVEGQDFVTCQICGAQGLDLRRHIAGHGMDEARYHAQFSGHSLIAETYAHLVKESRRRRKAGPVGLTPIRDILPTVAERLTKAK